MKLVDNNSSDWNEITDEFSDQNLIQREAYGTAKSAISAWNIERAIFLNDETIVGAVQVFIRSIPLTGRSLAWVNRGPLWQTGGAGNVAELSGMIDLLRRQYVGEKRGYLRVQPTVIEGTKDAEVLSIPEFVTTSVKGWASSTVNLTEPLDLLRSNLKQKWRNALNKAERAPIELRSGPDDHLLDVFIESQQAFYAARRMKPALDENLLRHLQSSLPPSHKLRIFAVFENGSSIASALFASYGEKCEYLAGNSTQRGRQVNAGQLLLWNALAEYKNDGIKVMDLGGFDPERTPKGIYNFKRGLNGEFYRLMPEIEVGSPGILGAIIGKAITHIRSRV